MAQDDDVDEERPWDSPIFRKKVKKSKSASPESEPGYKQPASDEPLSQAEKLKKRNERLARLGKTASEISITNPFKKKKKKEEDDEDNDIVVRAPTETPRY